MKHISTPNQHTKEEGLNGPPSSFKVYKVVVSRPSISYTTLYVQSIGEEEAVQSALQAIGSIPKDQYEIEFEMGIDFEVQEELLN